MPDPTSHTTPSRPAGPTLHCPRCRHELTGLPGAGPGADPETALVCPECGRATTVLAALDVPGGDRGWGFFLLWVVSGLMVLMLGGCVLTVLGALVWSAVGRGP